MASHKLILVGGGVRSGKSAFALNLARTFEERRVYLATGEALDAEMHERIARHRRDRGPGFETLEEPVNLVGALERCAGAGCVVVDCLTFWVSNLLLRGEWPDAILERAEGIRAFLEKRSFPVILVTNEVGMGVVPDNAMARAFRDACGLLHQLFSREADEVYFAVMGTVLRLKPGPAEAVVIP